MNYDPKIIDDYIKSIYYYNFQDFCDRLLLTLYPNDYTPVRAGGRNGDMKNDGYCTISRIFFQAHATRGESSKQTKNKIESDLKGCLEKWEDVTKFIYITNDTLIGEIEHFVDGLRKRFPSLIIETWGNKKLSSEIRKLKIKDIEYVIDRKIIPEVTILESEILSAKYLITNEFNFIKEISQNDLSNFPFENPLLFENNTLKFLRSLINGQSYRHTDVEKVLNIKEQEYVDNHKDAIVLPFEKGEYRFFYHERIPTKDEIRTVLKSDNISQFLLNNNIPENRISKINTCYEGECAGGGNFQEVFYLRPFYAQFLIVKNISNAPIKLETINSFDNDVVLYSAQSKSEINHTTKLPNFIIEPNQNVIIPIGLFLSEFKEIQELEKDIVTSTYVPEQVQELHIGKMDKGHKIEYIGPSISPKEINAIYKERKISLKTHDFSFDSLYWINRYWQCGSCPHLFYVTNEKFKYQGEIFNVLPNHLQKEIFTIPDGVYEVIIAELEQETTLINKVLKNGNVFDSDILLIENQSYTFSVSPMDIIELEGKYTLKSNIKQVLPVLEKKELVEKFKKNYA